MCDYFEKEPETEAFKGNIILCLEKPDLCLENLERKGHSL